MGRERVRREHGMGKEGGGGREEGERRERGGRERRERGGRGRRERVSYIKAIGYKHIGGMRFRCRTCGL